MSATDGTEVIRDRVRALMPNARSDLATLVSHRSIANPELAPRDGNSEAASFLEEALAMLELTIESRDMPDGTRTVIASASAPPDAPTVLLYSHYDVQPPGDESAWLSDPWELTDRGGRWYARGSADSKGNIVAHLTALRALDGDLRCGIKVVFEGSEEWPSPGLETFVQEAPETLDADAMLIADCGSPAVDEPGLTTSLRGSVVMVVTVKTLESPVHSGSFGGAAPDALAALIRILDSFWDERGTATVGQPAVPRGWTGKEVPESRFRQDAGVLEGVDLVGDGPLADRIWLRSSITVVGIDAPAVQGSLPAIPASARARIALRVPPGVTAKEAEQGLVAQIRRATPWNAEVEIVTQAATEPFASPGHGTAFSTFRDAVRDAYGREPTEIGEGGAIPVCSAFSAAYPSAEILLYGVEEPLSAIHSPNESVDPGEIERIALAECLFLMRYAGVAATG